MSGKIAVFTDLIKYRLSAGVTFSAVTGYLLYSGISGPELIYLIPGVFLLSSGSAALNQYTEQKEDALMERTRSRPLPSKLISGKSALKISLVLLFTGSILLLKAGVIPFFLGILNLVLYNFLYTSLKKRTVLAIIPGALVGAFVPLIGYTTAGAPVLNGYIVIFSIFMFLWQLPHFWLILIRYENDYKAAGFPTILQFLNEKKVKYLVFIWVTVTTAFLIITGSLYIGGGLVLLLIILNIIFIHLFYRFLFNKNSAGNIRYGFILINTYSFIVMVMLIALSVMRWN